jgi:hypothetical protein
MAEKYAEQIHVLYVDYYSALADGSRFLKDGYSMDGPHPNDKGYGLMAPPVQAAVEKGAYPLQLTVRDKQNKDQSRTASQAIDFEIRKEQ